MRANERRRSIAVLLLLVAGACVAVACGSSDPGTGTGTGTDDGGTGTPDTGSGTDASAARDAARDVDSGPSVPAVCPPQMARTGELTGNPIDREGFGCYGACGPACKAACLDDQITTTVTAKGSDGTTQCLSCTYTVKTCKSHAFCRWHDDCYRQCDLRWDAINASAPANDPNNACYINCDQPVLKTAPICGEDWTQLTATTPSIRDSCWDGSFNSYSTLLSQSAVPGTCGDSSDSRPRPWNPDQGTWTAPPATPVVLPEGFSCTHDTDCPDRNQKCDPSAGTILGLNGSGLCVDQVPSPKVDVTQLQPGQTWVADGGLPSGQACHLGYECAGGLCKNNQCQ